MSKPHRVSLTDLIQNDVAPAVQAAASAPREVAAVEPPPAPAVSAPAPAAPTRSAPVRAPRGPTLRARTKQLSLYLEEPVYEELRSLAFSERVKMHQLIVEGVDLMLRKRGHPSIKDLMKKANQPGH
ncbi:MAG: hypothetical protein HYX38_04950 [Rhodospirillales bacterium]|nr:hypothetical protein [Rhodospirillales bacterium]